TTTSTPTPPSVPTSVVGDWETAKTPSNLGTTVTLYQFGKDGDFHGRVSFVDSPMPPAVITGTYVVRRNIIETRIADQVHSATFRFDKDELVIEENGTVLRFHRK